MHALLFALLFTVAGPGVSTPVHALGDLALVPVRDGFVMAWSDGPRIFAERLDASLQPVSAPFSFPLVTPSSATSLALASNGTSVLVTWHEVHGVNLEVQYAAILDADARSMPYGPLFISQDAQPSAAGVKNGRYRILAYGQVWTLNDSLGTESIDFPADAVAAAFSASGDTATAKKKTSVSCRQGGGLNLWMFWQTCDYDEEVTFAAPAGRSGFSFQWHTSFAGGKPGSDNGSDPVLLSPLVAPNGDGFLGAVSTSAGWNVCEVRDNGRTWTIVKPLLAIAGNGTDVLTVWRDSALRATFLGGETFTLSDDGGSAKIVPAGSNAFVVIYSRGSSIVAQKVTVQPPRGRAVR